MKRKIIVMLGLVLILSMIAIWWFSAPKSSPSQKVVKEKTEHTENETEQLPHKKIEYQYSTNIIPITIEKGIISCWFVAEREEGDIVMTIISPNGTEITPECVKDNPYINYTEDGLITYYKAANPEGGTWYVKTEVFNMSRQKQNVTVYATISGGDSIYHSMSPDKDIYEPNEIIKITAELKGNDITNATIVRAVIEKPDGADNIELTDIGNGDYNAFYDNATAEGTYNLKVYFKGMVRGSRFERYANTFFEVRKLPDFKVDSSDIVVSNLTPKSGDTINVNVTVWNIGNAEDNVTIKMYYGGHSRIDTSAVIGANKNITLSTSLEMWESGNHTIRVELNPFPHFFDSHTPEKKLTNNKANKTLNVKAVKIFWLDCFTNKIDYKQNERGTIECSVVNYYDRTPASADYVTVDINGTRFNLTQPDTITRGGVVYNLIT